MPQEKNFYTIGKFYYFTALHFFDDSNGIKYIALDDGSDIPQKVRPFDFQTEWEDLHGKTIKCYCAGYTRLGNPIFEQAYYDILCTWYNEEEKECTFTVLNCHTDTNTNADFYVLSDVYGLTHRYYSKNKHEKQELIKLRVKGVTKKDGNKAHLNLEPLAAFTPSFTPNDILNSGKFGQENQKREFKTTIVYTTRTTPDIGTQLGEIARTLAGFMNTDGGTLFIGVNDNGEISGIEPDIPYLNSEEEDAYTYKLNCDGYEQKIRNKVISLLGQAANAALHFKFKIDEGKVYCVITVDKVDKPIYFDEVKLFQRQGNMTLRLKGEAITYFIAKRLGIATSAEKILEQVYTSPQEEQTFGVEVNKLEPIKIKNTVIAEEDKELAEFYITFYIDGSWSYQNNKKEGEDVISNIPITKSQRENNTSRLIQCYDNGYANAVLISDVRQKAPNTSYPNGWNVKAKLIASFCCDLHDLIVFFSKDEDRREWVKVHYASIVNLASMNAKGCVVVPNDLGNAYPTCVKCIGKQLLNRVSALIVNDDQATKTLGVKTRNKQFSAPVKLLKNICLTSFIGEEQSESPIAIKNVQINQESNKNTECSSLPIQGKDEVKRIPLRYEDFNEWGIKLLHIAYNKIFEKSGKIIKTTLESMQNPVKNLFVYFDNTEKKALELFPTQKTARDKFCNYIQQFKIAAIEIQNKSEQELICEFYGIPFDKNNWKCLFTINHKRPPYMYLEYEAMMDKDRDVKSAHWWWNVQVLNKPQKAVAAEFNVSDETIRLHVNKFERTKGLLSNYMVYYPQLNKDVICTEELAVGEIDELLKEEHLNDVFENNFQKAKFIGRLLNLKVVTRNAYTQIPEPLYLIKDELTYGMHDFYKLLETGVIEDTIISLSKYTDEQKKSAAREVAIKIHGCIQTKNVDELLFVRNKANVIMDICKAMELKPIMHIDEIFTEYHKLPLVKKLNDIEQLRTYLQRAGEYIDVFKDKSSRFTLKKWNIDTRSRRDIMRDLIKNSGRPVSNHELLDAVKKSYPNATMGEIQNLLSNDPDVKSVKGSWIHCSMKI